MMRSIVIIAVLLLLAGCSPLKESRTLYGTFAEVTVYGDEGSIPTAFLEAERLNGIFSTYNPNSSISRLNRDGFAEDKELASVIKASLAYSLLTNGSFDITVKPVLDYYAHVYSENGTFNESDLKAVLSLVNYSNLRVKDDTVGFIDFSNITIQGKVFSPGVTLDAIAKGYAIDRMAETLMSENITSALLNIGGDIRAIGTKPDGDWQLALQNPRAKDDFIAIIPLHDSSVATSGDYERYFTPDKKVHHIIDPKTGQSAGEMISVTITARNAMDADALATAVFAMGTVGLELVESLGGVEGLLITSDRKILKSSGFKENI